MFAEERGDAHGGVASGRTSDSRVVAGPPERGLDRAGRPRVVAFVYADVSAGGPSRQGGDGGGHGRQSVPGLHGGDRGGQRGALSSQGGGGHPEAGRAVDPHVGDRLLLRAADPVGGATGGGRAGVGAEAGLLHQQRGGVGRGGAQAVSAAHGAAAGDRVLAVVPRPDLRGDVAFGLQADPPPGILAVGGRHPPRRLQRPGERGAALEDGLRPRGDGGDLRRADPGRGGLRRPRRRLPAATGSSW